MYAGLYSMKQKPLSYLVIIELYGFYTNSNKINSHNEYNIIAIGENMWIPYPAGWQIPNHQQVASLVLMEFGSWQAFLQANYPSNNLKPQY